eukprot:gene2176-2472_t
MDMSSKGKRAVKRRRTYELTGIEIAPYRKKPKIRKSPLIPLDDVRRNMSSEVINMSPTSHAVVAETLKRSMQIATECGKQGIVVTYDLAIAKIAMQIQDEEMPLYDKVFIALGPFHVEMALFNAFGKYISESGGPHVLNECLVLAKGSTKLFQTVNYHGNLLKLPESHPEVYEEFQKKWFAVKQTMKSFSRTPIDLTLEQTINADAASQRTGISALTNSISARQRWAESHFLRTTIISTVFEDLVLTKKEDVSNDLKHHHIKKSHENRNC